MKRSIATSILLAVMTLTIRAQFSIDGRQVAYDSLSHIILATVPQSVYNTDLQAHIQLNDNCTLLMINGQVITDSYTFHNVTPTHRYMTSFATSDGRIASGHIVFTTLPIVQLKGNFGYSYNTGQLLVSAPDSSFTETFTPQVKWRGGTTNGANKHKRNYKIKLPEDHSFFGLRNDNNWLLDAGQADVFRLRNLIANEIWGDFATKPYYADKKGKARSCISGQVVEVFLNDEYRGIYAFTENLDRKQMKLKKVDETTGEIHGCLWKSKSHSMAAKFGGYSQPYDNSKETWEGFEVKYPELNDNDTTDWSTLVNAIEFSARSTEDEFLAHYEEYFDIPVTIDYFIFQNVLSAADNNGKNMFWAVYDKAVDKKLTLAVWDLDCTVGQRWVTKSNKEAVRPDYRLEYSITLIERLIYEMGHAKYTQQAIDRYRELRQHFFTTDSLCSRYRHYSQLLQQCGADKREAQRWSGDSDIDGETIDFEAETAYICQWIPQRLAYLDQCFDELDEQLSISHINTHHPATNHIYSITGQQINPSHAAKPGIYIKNGKKYILR